MKQAWQKPQLIVLVRSKPEEAVLAFCKGGTHTGPITNEGGCVYLDFGFCVVCSNPSAS